MHVLPNTVWKDFMFWLLNYGDEEPFKKYFDKEMN